MKVLGAKVLVLLFAVLVVRCAFDGPAAHASTDPGSLHQNAFCAVLHSSAVDHPISSRPGFPILSGNAIYPPPGGYPVWSLAHSIDHPPERPA
jgi:hypothetical protein